MCERPSLRRVAYVARTGLRCAKPGYAPLGMTKEAGMALRNSREWLHGLKTFIFSLTCAASRLLGMTNGSVAGTEPVPKLNFVPELLRRLEGFSGNHLG